MPDTKTGIHFQNLVEMQLRNDGWMCQPQSKVGLKPDGGQHRVDFTAWRPDDDNRKILVSCKVQNCGGSVEEKLPYEVIKLLHTMDHHREYVAAYLILGGTGWSKGIQSFVKVGLPFYIKGAERVIIYTTDEMISIGFKIPAGLVW